MIKARENCILKKDIETHKPLYFKSGPVTSTSVILDIAVLESEITSEEQEEELSSANNLLLNRFLSINRDFFSEKYKESDLINRNDLFEKWIVLTWFTIKDKEEYIFLARAKFLWLELFLKFYNHLCEKKFSKDEIDELFLELTNVKFVKYLDIYRWIEYEMQDLDIDTLKVLEAIPHLDSYIEFGDDFYKRHIQTTRPD